MFIFLLCLFPKIEIIICTCAPTNFCFIANHFNYLLINW